MRAIHSVTAHNRDQAFQAFNTASLALSHYKATISPHAKAFERDVIRSSIYAARWLRVNGHDYPEIP